MAKVGMKPIINLKIGDKISPRFNIDKVRVQNWQYANECVQNFSPIAAGSELEIFEICSIPGNAWVKVYLPHTHNTMSFKIAGGELSSLFQLIT